MPRKTPAPPTDALPLTMDDIARRFLATPPAPKPQAKKKPRKRSK